MKKNLIVCFLITILCLTLSGCNKSINELEDVSMIIKEGTLTKTGATVIITELSDKDYTYGEFYRIDKKNGKWKELKKIVDSGFWNTIGYNVDGNNKLELEHNWAWLYGELESGEYRLVKEVNNKYFWVEFEIN